MEKKVIKELEFETCPKCGKVAYWTGSEVDKERYVDSYCCGECSTKYSIVFNMSYDCHFIGE